MGGVKNQEAIVIGGGISGLATALALYQADWSVRVFEQASSYQDVGSGITLSYDALSALDSLNLGDQVREVSSSVRFAGFRTKKGGWLLRMPKSSGKETVLIHRADLLQILFNALPKSTVVFRSNVRTITTTEHSVTVGTVSGRHTADLLVGADGIDSLVRKSLWPAVSSPVYAGYGTWRFDSQSTKRFEMTETWDTKTRVGIVPYKNGDLYMYIPMRQPENNKMVNFDLIKQMFQEWHYPIPELINNTNSESAKYHKVYYLKPLKSFVKQRVALIGDAAHGMTPDMASGASEGLKDAVQLTQSLQSHATLGSALSAYDKSRRKPSQNTAKRSLYFGKIVSTNRYGAYFRNIGMRSAGFILRLITSIR